MAETELHIINLNGSVVQGVKENFGKIANSPTI